MPAKRIIMHLDMNSYFASVEQQANPTLRGKPLGVVATMTPHGCILASSKEAKAVGIKTGCRADEAKFLYPDIILVEVDPSKYRSTTEKIFSIIRQYSDDIEPYSIDEAFINLTGYAQSFNDAVRIGREIKREIFGEAGEWLTNSMGIAPTRWLAKFGSDTCEKGGIVVLDHSNLSAYLKGRDLTEAWGIADRTAARLHLLGIRTLDELMMCEPHALKRLLGIRGHELWANVNGIELAPARLATPVEQPKSIGHSHVLRTRTTDRRFYQSVLMRLAERTGRDVRTRGLEAQGLFVSVGLREGGYYGKNVTLSRSLTGGDEIFRLGWRILERLIGSYTAQSFAIGVFRLRTLSHQGCFWAQPRKDAVYAAMDVLNDRFGEETVHWGTLHRLAPVHAPDRIGFRKTVSTSTPRSDLMLKTGTEQDLVLQDE
ncbi:MAG: hypothetical protein A2898_04340 [Candidatus Kerfeldbacteria bacterium RIFCSPLOWO2_01_FULL_48_11]|uniref:UmuC domain-containing protein n=1 Tax=Candidatus Kerfeldbacteria bacterium RIFCSPLOWO2_01_FULL_48_11 TaxID=1798543 RepID=A0A1G2B1E7_9BACT|nr:MAG: polymerase IV protein [Parcubacteria group bacterium GW2011_GWC2_49_9]OGY82795.1 MAG: hypothetical protein A2898_04340 [Candidatus Kerfeldbacteria bacterium RIFCSPLOWO2_01_FULL_48_11]HCJ52479.1 hypothetical protein [Candidatus Kerfeldbacteria bacterium]